MAPRQKVPLAPFGVCPSCPVRQECGPGLRAWTVTRPLDQELLDAALAHKQTAAGRAALRTHKQFIELVYADAKVNHCLARPQRRRRDNMLIQAVLTTITMTLRKLVQFQLPRMRGRQLREDYDPVRVFSGPSGASPTEPTTPERYSPHSRATCSRSASRETLYGLRK